MNRNIRQSQLFDAALIADAHIHTLCPAQVCSHSSYKQIVFGCHGTLDAPTRRNPVFTDSQTGFCSPLEEYVAHNHSKRSFASQLANTVGQDDHLAKPMSTVVAFE